MSAAVVEYTIGLRDAFSAIAEKIGRATGALNEIMAALGKATVNTEEALARLKPPAGLAALTKETQAAEKAMQGLGAAVNNLNRMQPPLLGAHKILTQRAAEAEAAARGAETAVAGGGRIGPHLYTGMGLLALSQIGTNNVLGANREFDEAVRLTRGVLAGRASDADIDRLRGSAMDIARGGVYTPTDVMGAFHDLGTKGVPLANMPMMTRKVLGIATGAGEDIKSTLDTHLDIVRMFNLGLDKLPHISDTIATAQMRAGASLANSKEFFKMAGPGAAISNQSFEDMTALEEGLALKGIKGSLAGTGVGMALMHMNTWTKKQAGIYKDLGIGKDDIVDPATHKLKPVLDVLSKLAEATTPDKLKPGQTQFGIFSDLFGARAARTVSALVQSLDAVKGLREELNHADGAAERMGEQGLKGLSAAMKEMGSAWQQLDLAIGKSGFNEQVENLTRKFTGLLDSLSHGSPLALQGAGWLAMLGNALSAAAMPLLSLTILGPMAWNALKWTAGVSGAGLSALAKGLWEVVAAARALVGLTGLGAIAAALATIYELSTRPGFAQKYLQEERTDHDAVNALLKKFGIGGDAAPSSTTGGYLGGLSDAAKNLMSSGAQRIIVESEIKVPESIRIQVDATGPNGTRGSAESDLPISATHPLGTTIATPPSPPVVR